MTTRARLAGWTIAWALRLQALTWRRGSGGLERIDALLAAQRRLLVLFWHGKYVPLFALVRTPDGCIFTTRSFRGDVISEICRRFGHRPVEIPADGEAALEHMRRAIGRSRLAATAADGPLGPHHEVKHGVIELACDTHSVILPVSVGARRKWILSKRWDRMEIPALFTRVHVATGEPIELPPTLDASAVHAWSERVRAALEALDARVEHAAHAATAG